MNGDAHGGDVLRMSRESGIPAERILDFSANINPLGLPAPALNRLAREVRDGSVLAQYPDPEATELRTVLSRRLGVPVESVIVGAGADSLIHATVHALAPRRCIIPVPAFSEYERACRACRTEVHRIPLPAAAGFALDAVDLGGVAEADLVILNNPHNPTGSCVSRGVMWDRIGQIRSAAANVLVDEAFIDYVPDAAITNRAACTEGVVAVRSLTKFFGCPGLRGGYAVAAPDTAARVKAQLPAWPVTTLALNALVEAVRDEAYQHATLASNARSRAILVEALERLGCRVFPPSANYVFFQVPEAIRATEVRQRLLRDHAILVRECNSFTGLEPGRYLRVAVRLDSENRRLIDGLESVLGGPACRQDT